jgi:GT2 family glycosyltransferase
MRLPLSSRDISVIIPAFNSPEHLDAALQALSLSSVPPGEVIVVDDCSEDGTAGVAERWGATIYRTRTRSGPAHARNIGALHSRGALLLFLDADVCVHSDTIELIVAEFESRPGIDAVIGSYDEEPGPPDILSQYRNLLHSFVHRNSRRTSATFWAGCGAIRRDVFLTHGGFDETYLKPAVEDIELGMRLSRAGRRISLVPSIQVKHLKEWKFLRLMETDILRRGIPWTRLILRERSMPSDLNLKWEHRISVSLSCLLAGVLVLSPLWDQGRLLTSSLGLILIAMAPLWSQRTTAPESGGDKLTLAVLFGVLAVLSFVGNSPLVFACVATCYGALLLRRLLFFRSFTAMYVSGGVAAVCLLLAGLAVTAQLAPNIPTLLAGGCALTMFFLNLGFYRFLARRVGYLSTFSVIPIHWLHYLSSAVAFLTGLFLFVSRRSPAPARVPWQDPLGPVQRP